MSALAAIADALGAGARSNVLNHEDLEGGQSLRGQRLGGERDDAAAARPAREPVVEDVCLAPSSRVAERRDAQAIADAGAGGARPRRRGRLSPSRAPRARSRSRSLATPEAGVLRARGVGALRTMIRLDTLRERLQRLASLDPSRLRFELGDSG